MAWRQFPFVFSFLFLINPAFPLWSSDSQASPVLIRRLSKSVTLDGHMDEDAWQEATLLSLIMQTPHFGEQPSEKSEILVGFDDDYIYFGA
jgi:hypothetical protein